VASVNDARLALSTAQSLCEQDATASFVAFERAVSLATSAGDRDLQAEAELGWGVALSSLGGRELESLPHLESAAVLGGGSRIEALSWLTMADIFVSRDPDRALAAYTKAAKLFKDLGDPFGAGSAHIARAQLLQVLQRDEEAVPDLALAANFALEDSAPPVAAQLVLDVGELLLRLGRKEEAFPFLTAAAEMFRTLEDWRLEARTCGHLLSIANEANNYSERTRLGIRLAELAVKQAEQEGDPQLQAMSHLFLTQLLEEQEESEGNNDD
jgi:tetratricopeptide (TPR) repeat protein